MKNSRSMSLQELASYSRLDHEAEQMISLSLQETPRKKKMIVREPATVENKIVVQRQRKPVREERASREAVKSESPTRALIEGTEVDREEDGERAIIRLEAPFVKSRKTVKKRRGKEILSKVCALEVCKPEICCADMEGKLPFLMTAQTSFRWVGKAIYFSLSMRRPGRRGRIR